MTIINIYIYIDCKKIFKHLEIDRRRGGKQTNEWLNSHSFLKSWRISLGGKCKQTASKQINKYNVSKNMKTFTKFFKCTKMQEKS